MKEEGNEQATKPLILLNSEFKPNKKVRFCMYERESKDVMSNLRAIENFGPLKKKSKFKQTQQKQEAWIIL